MAGSGVRAARKNILAAGLYGTVTARRFDGKELPYVDNLVNLVIADDPGGLSRDEIMRVLVPGGTAIIGGEKIVKPWPDDIDEWTHYLHGPDNNAVAGDRVYVTLGIDAPVVEIDAATGEVLKTFEGTQRSEEISVSDGVLYLVVGTSEVVRTGGGLHTRREPDPTSFRYIAAYDIGSGDPIWKHEAPEKGFILPLTLTVTAPLQRS